MDIHHVKRAYLNLFDRNVGCMNGDKKVEYKDKMCAFQNYEYLLFPRYKRGFVQVDIDYPEGGASWIDHDLPMPTVVIINPENFHAHLVWMLKEPVLWHFRGQSSPIRRKPIMYFNAIRKAIEKRVEADPGYTCASTKNPFSKRWNSRWSEHVYSLDDLAEYVDLKGNLKIYGSTDGVYVGRNDELFNFSRKHGYRQVIKFESFERFEDYMREFCMNYNQTTIPLNWPARGSLPHSEADKIARSVSRWIWQKKDDKQFKQYVKNVGVMKIKRRIFEDDGTDISNNKSLGAIYSSKVKSDKSISKINDAITELIIKDTNLTYRNISMHSGLSISTIYKYKYLIDPVVVGFYKMLEKRL